MGNGDRTSALVRLVATLRYVELTKDSRRTPSMGMRKAFYLKPVAGTASLSILEERTPSVQRMHLFYCPRVSFPRHF